MEILNNCDTKDEFVKFGIDDLDNILNIQNRGNLIVVGGRPEMGKTTFAFNTILNSIKKGLPTLLFSLEMNKELCTTMLLSAETMIKIENIKKKKFNENEIAKLEQASHMLENDYKLIIDDTPGISVTALEESCKKYKEENDIKLVVIDYLQLMKGTGRANSREQEFSEISSILKNLARELDITIILLTQLSRAVEARNNHRPKLSDIRESGAIEQDADIVIFLYRDEYYNQDTTDKNLAEAIVAKNRYGLNETVKFKFLPEYCKCRNLENK